MGESYVSSSCRSFVLPLLRRCSLIAAFLLSLATLAHAGTYVWKITDTDPTKSTESPVYSGGAIHYSYPDGTLHDEAYMKITSSPVLYGNNIDEGVNPDCSGVITTTFTWHADPGQTAATDPPPATVIVTEVCHVIVFGYSDTIGPVVGICDTGLGVSSALAQSQSPSGGTRGTADLTATRFKAVPGGQTVTITCTPRAQCTGPFPTVQVRYTPSISPVSVYPGGVTFDPATKSLKVLTGQQITGTLSGIPFAPGPGSTYQWSVSTPRLRLIGPPDTADVFYDYNPNDPNFHQLTLLSEQPGATAGPSFAFYDKFGQKITILCTANLVAPDGTSLAVVANSRQILVVKPVVTKWDIATGYVYNYQPTRWGLGKDPATPNPGGESWSKITITVPAPFAGGQGTLTQLLTPDRESYNAVGPSPTPYNNLSNNKQKGLDGSFIYGTAWTVPALGSDDDSPCLIIPGSNPDNAVSKLTASDTFTTWIMYQPVASVINQKTVWVPLSNYSWAWSETVSWLTDHWSLTAGVPVDAAHEPTRNSTSTNEMPVWTLVH